MLGPNSMLAVEEDSAYSPAGSSHLSRATSYSPVQAYSQPHPPGSLPHCPSVLPALFLPLSEGRLNLRGIRAPKEGVILGSVYSSEPMPSIRKEEMLDSRSLRFASWSVLGKLS